ncbi:MAG TPA: hypothetical protein VIH79_02685 [Candidatus Nanopelagicaceae bacterium]
MTTKRDLIRELKSLKKKPRALLPAECDELILLLGGTIRQKHRPEVLVFGMNRRQINWGAIGSVVFSFLENAERLTRLEAELKELSSPDYLKKVMASLPRTMTAKNRAEAKRVALENLTAELTYLKSTISALRPISTKKRAEAERMASEWFSVRGTILTPKNIQNALDSMRQSVGFKRLGLVEWCQLMKN